MMNSSITLDTGAIINKTTMKIHVKGAKNSGYRLRIASWLFKVAAIVVGPKSLVTYEWKNDEDEK